MAAEETAQCSLCRRNCTIAPDEVGFCRRRRNVHRHPGENTFCPSCGQLLMERRGYKVP